MVAAFDRLLSRGSARSVFSDTDSPVRKTLRGWHWKAPDGHLFATRVLHGLGMALVLVAPKGGLLPTNQIATVGKFRW